MPSMFREYTQCLLSHFWWYAWQQDIWVFLVISRNNEDGYSLSQLIYDRILDICKFFYFEASVTDNNHQKEKVTKSS